MNAATTVFSITELLELILLSLPNTSTSQELLAFRTILLGRTTTRAWHALLTHSTHIRQRLYQPTPAGLLAAENIWSVPATCPPARPNPWIPYLMLHQRGWGAEYPFAKVYDDFNVVTTTPRRWTFHVEVSAAQYWRKVDEVEEESSTSWRAMLASQPPFQQFWYTRCVYELGSGQAPFATHMDYEPGKPKSRQKYFRHRTRGVTLGDIFDAVGELFGQDPEAQFVMIESLCPTEDRDAERELIPAAEPLTECVEVPGIMEASGG
jgi:hypothetical protein